MFCSDVFIYALAVASLLLFWSPTCELNLSRFLNVSPHVSKLIWLSVITLSVPMDPEHNPYLPRSLCKSEKKSNVLRLDWASFSLTLLSWSSVSPAASRSEFPAEKRARERAGRGYGSRGMTQRVELDRDCRSIGSTAQNRTRASSSAAPLDQANSRWIGPEAVNK